MKKVLFLSLLVLSFTLFADNKLSKELMSAKMTLSACEKMESCDSGTLNCKLRALPDKITPADSSCSKMFEQVSECINSMSCKDFKNIFEKMSSFDDYTKEAGKWPAFTGCNDLGIKFVKECMN